MCNIIVFVIYIYIYIKFYIHLSEGVEYFPNLALGQPFWATVTDTALFNDGSEPAHALVSGITGSVAFTGVDLGVSKRVGHVRAVLSVCK